MKQEGGGETGVMETKPFGRGVTGPLRSTNRAIEVEQDPIPQTTAAEVRKIQL